MLYKNNTVFKCIEQWQLVAVSQCDVLNKFTLESLHLLKKHRLENLLAKNRGLLLTKDFGEFINKTQTRLPEL